MALVKCPDCNTEISDAAPACLKCGRPMRAAKRTKPAPTQAGRSGAASGALAGFFLAFLVGFIGAHSACEPRTFEDGKYAMFNGVIALFIGLVGAVVGGAFGALRSKG